MIDTAELVEAPFQRLIEARQLVGHLYDGFWASMDTFKDKQQLERLYLAGVAPWEVWRRHASAARAGCGSEPRTSRSMRSAR